VSRGVKTADYFKALERRFGAAILMGFFFMSKLLLPLSSPHPPPASKGSGADRFSLSHDESRSRSPPDGVLCCLSTATEGKHGDNHDTFF
jgi:hypothetical protein